MPHVVIKGQPDLPAFFEHLEPVLKRDGDRILKTERAYLDQAGSAIILEARAIEAGTPQSFFVLVSAREDGAVVRVHPGSEVEKTPGVKRLLAAIAERLLKTDEGLSVGETNLETYLAS